MSIIVSSGAVSSGCIVQNDTMQVYGSALETTLKYGGSMTIFENILADAFPGLPVFTFSKTNPVRYDAR